MPIPTSLNIFKRPVIVADTTDMHTEEGREEWLKLRRNYIGGSDAAAALGVSPYASPVTLYFDKTGNLPKHFTDIQLQKMDSGNRMEPVIAEWFAEKTGKHVVKQPFFYSDPEYPFMSANVDYGVYAELAGLECKNTSYRDAWKDGPPDHFYIQCQHYMAVTGALRWYLAVCIDGWEFRYYTIERNEEIIEALRVNQTNFWNTFIVAKTPPAFDGSDATKELLENLYPEASNKQILELADEADILIEMRARLKESEKELKSNLSEVENQLKALIGEHEMAVTKNWTFKYAVISKKEHMVKASQYRMMNIRSRTA